MRNRVSKELRAVNKQTHYRLNRTFFLQPLTPEALLPLMGLRSRYSSSWRLNLSRYISTLRGPLSEKEKLSENAYVAKEIVANLKQLVLV
jgi:hypothetical protein